MEELNSLEKTIYRVIQKNTELVDFNTALQQKINELDRENEALQKRVQELENRAQSAGMELSKLEHLNPEEKSSLNNEINDLIEKINYHLRSST